VCFLIDNFLQRGDEKKLRLRFVTLDDGESGGNRGLPADAVNFCQRVVTHLASCGRRVELGG